MNRTAFLHKYFALITIIGWALTSYAQRYEMDRGRIYFGEELVMYADVQSFKDLGLGYAKDHYNVYMNGRVLENVDPSTFRLKAHSGHRQHGKGKEEPATHKGYYKTTFNVYYGDKKLDAMASSFVELGGGYAKDAFNVYYYGEKVKGAWASSFKYTGNGYAQDSFDAYYRGKKLE